MAFSWLVRWVWAYRRVIAALKTRLYCRVPLQSSAKTGSVGCTRDQEITWHQHSDLSIGCQWSRGLNSSSACLSIRPSMDEHPPTSTIWSKRRRRYLAELRTTSASNNDLVTRRTRLKLGERAFSVAAPRIWNQLPIEIKAATDTQAFKRKLKTHLFSAAYLQWNSWFDVYVNRTVIYETL